MNGGNRSSQTIPRLIVPSRFLAKNFAVLPECSGPFLGRFDSKRFVPTSRWICKAYFEARSWRVSAARGEAWEWLTRVKAQGGFMMMSRLCAEENIPCTGICESLRRLVCQKSRTPRFHFPPEHHSMCPFRTVRSSSFIRLPEVKESPFPKRTSSNSATPCVQ